MQHKTLQRILALSLSLSFIGGIGAFAPNNFLKPYDQNLRLATDAPKKRFNAGMNFEYGSTRNGKNDGSKKQNVLQIYDADQSFIAAVRGALVPAIANEFNPKLTAGAPVGWNDDGVRGHITYKGRFSMIDATLRGRYELPFDLVPGELGVSLYLPVRSAQVNGLTFADATAAVNAADADVRAAVHTHELTVATFKRIGGLDLGAWSKAGFGDAVLMLDWANEYRQEGKSDLENVALQAKLGVSMPTAPKRNEDKAFSVALGNDGAWSIPFGLGLDLDFKYHVRLGAEAEFEFIFDNTKNYRMKTADAQTRFFLINKGKATMDHGFIWKFNLSAGAFRFWHGVSLNATYEYAKRDDDRLVPQTNAFDAKVVNGAAWLKESNSHHMIFKASYDGWECPFAKKWPVTPQASLFYKLPLDGRNTLLAHTFGGQLAVNF